MKFEVKLMYGLAAMDRKRCSKNRVKTSEGKITILQAEFNEFGMHVPDKIAEIQV